MIEVMADEKSSDLSFWIRIVTVLLIGGSVFLTYYVIVVQKDYIVFSYETGPDTTLEE